MKSTEVKLKIFLHFSSNRVYLTVDYKCSDAADKIMDGQGVDTDFSCGSDVINNKDNIR